MAAPFDPSRLEVKGDAFPILDAAGIPVGAGYANFSVSTNGMLSYQPGDSARRGVELAWFDRGGRQLEVVTSGAIRHPRLSPDGKRIGFEQTDPEVQTTDIWVREVARGATSRLTFNPSYDVLAGFSPDGSQIIYSSGREGKGRLLRKASNGAGAEETLVETPEDLQAFDWSADGRYVIYALNTTGSNPTLHVLPLVGTGRKPLTYLQPTFSILQARFSPDSRFVAYASDESGRPEIYVQTFPESGGKWQISTNGGVTPAWRADGKELYYIAPDGKLMAVAVKTAATLEAGAPTALFETRLAAAFNMFNKLNYAVSADGKRFLLANLSQGAQSRPIRIVANWMAALKK